MSGADEDEFLREAESSSQISQNDREYHHQQQLIAPNNLRLQSSGPAGEPDFIDESAVPFRPMVPSYKMPAEERSKYFNQNRTSCIDYPKGIPDIERYLVFLDKEPRKPEQLLIKSYKEHSEIIQMVANYIKEEVKSKQPYLNNIL